MVLAGAVAGLCGGCRASNGRHEEMFQQLLSCRNELDRLRKANRKLQLSLAGKDRQIRTLQALGEKRLEKLFHVERIEFGSHTGGVDLDETPGDDGIRVYLRPVDRDGSTLKAAGAIRIQLYDLAAAPNENLVGRYEWSVDQAAKQWSGFVHYHYRLTCRWPARAPEHDEITVRAEFTDYLTGRRLTRQTTCRIERAPKPPQPAADAGTTG